MQGALRLRSLLPRSIGGQCLAGLVLGILAALLFGPRVALLTPLGQIFLRASQIAVMPYLICELIGALGSLQPASMRLLSRAGGVVLLAILASGALAVLLLPALLPALTSSAFFSPELLQPPEPPDLVSTYLPFNIFTALADDNFPAVVLFAAVLGVLVQGLPRRELLLEPLEQLRLLFRRLNKLVARIAPIGILGLTATTLSSLSPELLVRSQALLVLNLVALVLLFVLGFTAIVTLTPLDLAASWRILRGPLALTASSANLLIALPLLTESLREEFLRLLPDADPGRQQRALDEIGALLPVGFALPNLGQVVSLLFLPFAGWFVDRPLDPPALLGMLATGIPAVTGGLKSAVRQELQQLGLPASLIGLVQINGEWLYRQEKVLSLLGLALLVGSLAAVLPAGEVAPGQLQRPPAEIRLLPGTPSSPAPERAGAPWELARVGPLEVTRRSAELGLNGATLLVTLVHSANLLLLSTPPEELVWALSWWLHPLSRLGWPMERLGFTLLLALRFLPLVQEELQNLVRAVATRAVNFRALGWKGGLGLVLAVAERLLANLLLRAEQGAEALVARGGRWLPPDQLRLAPPLARRLNGLAALLLLALVGLRWKLGGL